MMGKALNGRSARFQAGQTSSSRAPGPHPAFIEHTIAAEPLEAGGGLASCRFTGIELQTNRADLERLGMSLDSTCPSAKPAVHRLR